MRRARQRFNAFVVLLCCLTAAGLVWSTVTWEQSEGAALETPTAGGAGSESVASVSVPRPG
jgi:hypothetical protein